MDGVDAEGANSNDIQENAIWGLAIINQNMAATAAKAGMPKANQSQKIR